MSKALVCDGEIVFSEQTDVTIIAHIVTAHSSSNPRKTPLSCIFWRTLNTLQETEVRKKTAKFVQGISYFKYFNMIGRYHYPYLFR